MPLGGPPRKFKRLFLAADLHGSEVVFRKMLSVADFYEADALLIGGDLTAKTIAPIIRQPDGRYRTRLAGNVYENLAESELPPLEATIANSGQYPYRVSEDEYEGLKADPKRIDGLFTQLMISQIHRWTDMAERHLAPRNVPLYWIGGNDDKPEALAEAQSTPHVRYVDEQVVPFDDDHELLGFGWTNISPWKTPRELPEDQLAARFERVMNRLHDPRRAIYLTHSPPFRTGLDTAPKLDTSTDPPRPVTQGGQEVLIPVGSTALRHAIEETQPLVGLHGHIHETRNATKLGRSVLVDPGSEYTSGSLRGAIVNLQRDRVLSYQFTTG